MLAADPQAVAARATLKSTGRGVAISQDPTNLASIAGYDLLPHRAAASWERLTAIGRAARAAGDLRRVDELRADAMMDLLIGEGVATGGPITHGGLNQPPTRTDPPPNQPPPGRDEARHHHFRHSPGCQLIQLSPGTFAWQTPLGMQYTTKPDPPLYDDRRYIDPC